MIAKGIDIFHSKWQVWGLSNCSLVKELKGHLGQVSVSHFHIALSRSWYLYVWLALLGSNEPMEVISTIWSVFFNSFRIKNYISRKPKRYLTANIPLSGEQTEAIHVNGANRLLFESSLNKLLFESSLNKMLHLLPFTHHPHLIQMLHAAFFALLFHILAQ